MSMSVIATRPERFTARVVAPLPRRPAIDLVVPVHNEEADLDRSVRRLHAFVRDRVPFSARITIADSASTDATPEIADALAAELAGVRVLHLNEKGRGRALAAAWMTSEARVLAHVELDLSTDLNVLLTLVAPVLSGQSEIAVGRSSHARGTERGPISRVYHTLLRVVLRARFTEAGCGFKAVRSDVARRLIPRVIDRGWFFDTELLFRAERAGVRIHEGSVRRSQGIK